MAHNGAARGTSRPTHDTSTVGRVAEGTYLPSRHSGRGVGDGGGDGVSDGGGGLSDGGAGLGGARFDEA
jgi:hypothetical protein